MLLAAMLGSCFSLDRLNKAYFVRDERQLPSCATPPCICSMTVSVTMRDHCKTGRMSLAVGGAGGAGTSMGMLHGGSGKAADGCQLVAARVL